MVLQLVASRRFRRTIVDVKSAFLVAERDRMDPINRPLNMTMPKGHVKKGLHLEQVFEVRGGHSLGDQPQLWWRTFERFLVEELKFDQHQMDPCVPLCFVSRGTNILDEHLPMKSLSFLQRWKFVLCAPCACE